MCGVCGVCGVWLLYLPARVLILITGYSLIPSCFGWRLPPSALYIYFILFYIMYYIHIVKRFRAHCGFYAIENKLLLIIILSRYIIVRFAANKCLT